MLYHISDVAGERLLGADFQWLPLSEATEEELRDDDGYLWAFHSHLEAQAFCNGYHACEGFAVPSVRDMDEAREVPMAGKWGKVADSVLEVLNLSEAGPARLKLSQDARARGITVNQLLAAAIAQAAAVIMEGGQVEAFAEKR